MTHWDDARLRLEQMRDELRAALARGRAELARPVESPSYRSAQSAAESASELLDREWEVMTQRSLERELGYVDEALARLDEGTYGTCVECGEPIEAERLAVRPQAIRRTECERRYRSRATAHRPRPRSSVTRVLPA